MGNPNRLTQFKIKNTHLNDLFFMMTIGVLFAWSLIAAIISFTVFSQDYLIRLGHMFMIISLVVFIFSNKRGLLLIAGILMGFLIFVLYGFFVPSYEPNLANQLADFLTRTFLFLTGVHPHSVAYEHAILWSFSTLVGIGVVFLVYVRFRFLILFAVGMLIYGIAFTLPYYQYTRSFYVFIFCLLVMFLKHLNQGRVARIRVEVSNLTSYLIAMTVLSLVIGVFIPMPAEGVMPNFRDEDHAHPFDYISEFASDFFFDVFFERFTPMEFSISSIGFGDGGGLLGGNLTLNDRVFMQVRTNNHRPFYLTGRIMDTYTGYLWKNNFTDEVPVDFDSMSQNLEVLEWIFMHQIVFSAQLHESIRAERLVQVDDIFEFLEVDPNDPWLDDTWIQNTRLFVDSETGFSVQVSVNLDEIYPWNINVGSLDEWWEARTIEIDTLDSRTASVFQKGMVLNIESPQEDLNFWWEQERNFVTEERMVRNTRYTITYMEPSRWLGRDEWLSDMLRYSHRGILANYSMTREAFKQNHGYELITGSIESKGQMMSFEAFLNDYLIPRSGRIHERYTVLPEALPERVKELAASVTAGASNDYDRMRLLEQFLSENFPYTLTPGPSPRNQDFVDHFLFNLQKGYCVHFATAFVVMARSLGMPTRYVEGFLVNGRSRNDDGYVEVLNNMAHAWPEVYFEGFGWWRFEPTPSSGLPYHYFGSSNVSNNTSTGGTRESAGQDAGAGIDFEEQVNTEEEQGMSVMDQANDGNDRPLEQSLTEEQQDVIESKSLVWFWTILPLTLIGSSIVAAILWKNLNTIRLRKANNREAILYSFGKLLSCLKIFNYEVVDGETIQQFMNRVCTQKFKNEKEYELLQQSVGIFEKVRYSNEEITDEERKNLEITIEILDLRMKNDFGKVKYYYYRTLLFWGLK